MNQTDWDLETDVVVVGAGGCGLVAALAAAEQGAHVLLLEKLAHIGGSTKLSTSMIPAAGTRFQRAAGIDDSPEIMANDILTKNGHTSDPELTRHLCRESASLVEWLVDHVGINLSLATDFIYGGHSRHRMHTVPSRTGAELVEQLLAAVKRTSNIVVVTNAIVQSLITDASGVIGAIVQTNEEERVSARKVILASSGFGANRDMVAQYCPEIVNALYFGGEGNTGEGIRWGMELGAATENMDAYQGHGSVAYPHGTLVTWVVIFNGGFMVNKDGKRFGDETEGYSAFGVRVLHQTDGLAYDIYDGRIHNSVQNFGDYQDCLRAGAIHHADTIEELARKLKLPADSLRQTLEEYHRAAQAGRDEFGRTSLGALSPPYYGVQVTGALFHTQGGLRIDKRARVLKKDGAVISNLYAGGGVAVGVSGRGPNGYLAGNGLLAALGWGKVAGQDAGRSI
jgi:fumarate reductase flavoprotein subunit